MDLKHHLCYSEWMQRINLLSLNKDQMAGFVNGLEWPSYRAKQILKWLYQEGVDRFDAMTNLSKQDRKLLDTKAKLDRFDCVRHQYSLDGTEKFLFRLSDGQEIESVLIPDENDQDGEVRNRLTLCISTQVGCSLDCRFCLTGTMGLVRNLAAHEIIGQLLEMKRREKNTTHIVLMGMGEPLANDREVIDAIHRMTDPTLMGISPRRITISTSGLVPQILRLGKDGPPVNLAISLNATTDSVRDQIMPAINKLYPLKKLISACRLYPVPPRRWLFFEYVLLSDINDSIDDAKRLIKLLSGIRSKVNLIPFNEFPGSPYHRPSDETVYAFQAILLKARIPTFIRKSRGRDILAACGQLQTDTRKATLSFKS